MALIQSVDMALLGPRMGMRRLFELGLGFTLESPVHPLPELLPCDPGSYGPDVAPLPITQPVSWAGCLHSGRAWPGCRGSKVRSRLQGRL